MRPGALAKVRCAIYTRVSTDQGLDQDFNSLDAQIRDLRLDFHGYGLGLFGRLGPAAALAIGIVVYVAQVVFSKWWLLRYRYGPVEWLWRTLMYGVRQPMLFS